MISQLWREEPDYGRKQIGVGWSRSSSPTHARAYTHGVAQLGHSAGKQVAVTDRYAAFDPSYLSGAAKALSELVELVRCEQEPT